MEYNFISSIKNQPIFCQILNSLAEKPKTFEISPNLVTLHSMPSNVMDLASAGIKIFLPFNCCNPSLKPSEAGLKPFHFI